MHQGYGSEKDAAEIMCRPGHGSPVSIRSHIRGYGEVTGFVADVTDTECTGFGFGKLQCKLPVKVGYRTGQQRGCGCIKKSDVRERHGFIIIAVNNGSNVDGTVRWHLARDLCERIGSGYKIQQRNDDQNGWEGSDAGFHVGLQIDSVCGFKYIPQLNLRGLQGGSCRAGHNAWI